MAHPPMENGCVTDQVPEDNSLIAQSTKTLSLLSTGIAPLAQRDIVIVQDAWAQLLPHSGPVFEAMALRWCFKCPNLTKALAHRLPEFPKLLHQLTDLALQYFLAQSQGHSQSQQRRPQASMAPSLQELLKLLAFLGVHPSWWCKGTEAFVWAVQTHVPILKENIENGTQLDTLSVLDRFFALHIATLAVQAMVDLRKDVESPIFGLSGIKGHWREMTHGDMDLAQMGETFFRRLLGKHPVLMDYFKAADMDTLSLHIVKALEILTTSFDQVGDCTSPLRGRLEYLAGFHRKLLIPTHAYSMMGEEMVAAIDFRDRPDGLFTGKEMKEAFDRIYKGNVMIMMHPMAREETLLAEAERWFSQVVAVEWGWSPDQLAQRMLDVRLEVSLTGTYSHTAEELTFGAKVAWRNAAKCIARVQWNNLVVRDRRHIVEPEEMLAEIHDHLMLATGGPSLLPVMTIFRALKPGEVTGPRFWSSQLIQYAGYKGLGRDGGILGDAATADFTEFLVNKQLWQPPETPTAFDVLPIILKVPNCEPFVHALPADLINECHLKHPTCEAFNDLGLRWYTVPSKANLVLSIGGVDYPCVPFTNWSMELSIAQTLIDRFGVCDQVADSLAIDRTEPMWNNKVYAELSAAIVHSFRQQKVTLVDHNAAAISFVTHCRRERDQGRVCPGNWKALTAGMGSSSPLWNQEMHDIVLEPKYRIACQHWRIRELDGDHEFQHHHPSSPKGKEENKDSSGPQVIILFGSETGMAESIARRLFQKLRVLRPTIAPLNDWASADRKEELRLVYTHLIVVTSTAGRGGPPANAQAFLPSESDVTMGVTTLEGLKYCVLALGSSIYPDFCRFGISVDKWLAQAHAEALLPLCRIDDAKGTTSDIAGWVELVERLLLPLTLKSRLLGGDSKAEGKESDGLVVEWLDDEIPEDCERSEDELLAALEVPIPERWAGMTRVTCSSNRELLHDADGNRSIRCISFAFPDTQSQLYTTGDHLVIHPLNDCKRVLRTVHLLGLAHRLNSSFDAYVMVRGHRLPAALPVRLPVSLGSALRMHLDLALHYHNFIDLLRVLDTVAGDNADTHVMQCREWLRTLEAPMSSAEDKEQALNAAVSHYPYIDRFLAMTTAAGVNLTFAHVLPVLGRLTSRYYSISSSNRQHPTEPHITVRVLSDMTNDNEAIEGVCSHYLASLRPGDAALVTVRDSAFRLPQDMTLPVVMVGPGTGIAPMIGFLQERAAHAAEGSALGLCHVFTGCRYQHDRIYVEQLNAWSSAETSSAGDQQVAISPVISDLQIALSRQQPGRLVYVQNLIEEMGPRMSALLLDQDTHFYICGDASMADGVFQACAGVLRKYGAMSRVSAVRHLQLMRAHGRWLTDIWGVLSHFAESRDAIRHKKKEAAKLWLQNFSSRVDSGSFSSKVDIDESPRYVAPSTTVPPLRELREVPSASSLIQQSHSSQSVASVRLLRKSSQLGDREREGKNWESTSRRTIMYCLSAGAFCVTVLAIISAASGRKRL